MLASHLPQRTSVLQGARLSPQRSCTRNLGASLPVRISMRRCSSLSEESVHVIRDQDGELQVAPTHLVLAKDVLVKCALNPQYDFPYRWGIWSRCRRENVLDYHIGVPDIIGVPSMFARRRFLINLFCIPITLTFSASRIHLSSPAMYRMRMRESLKCLLVSMISYVSHSVLIPS